MKKLISILLLVVFPAGILMAQQAPAGMAAQPNFVFDDDGGAVQIVPADLTGADAKKFHGGAVMTSVQQVSVFLGSAWGDPKIRARETTLLDLARNGGPQFADLSKHDVRILAAGAVHEDFSDLSHVQLNDLVVQHKLADMLASKSVSAPRAGTVYLVFLAPGVSSSLGGHKPGTDYAAYHNFFHLQAGEVRYVVVPFSENATAQQAAAARALVDTALSPHGDGWY